MMLGASCDGATSEVSKPEKDVEPDAEDPDHRAVPAKCNEQIARESVHGIDAGETAPPERGERVARLLEHFCSQLVRDSTRGIRVARLSRDDQLGPRKLKKFRLITKQNKGARREEPSQEWPPYWPSESNLRLLAAKGLEWRVDSRARPRGAHAVHAPSRIPHRGDSLWCYLRVDAFSSDGAQRQSQLL